MNILVVGCGRVGAELARMLALRGEQVTVIDQDPAAFTRLGSAPVIPAVAGVGFDREVLLRAGIEWADGLAAVTGSDEANVVIARIAMQIFRVPRVVARLYDPRKAEIYQRLGLRTIAPLNWGVNRLAEALSFAPMHTTASLGAGGVDLVELEAPGNLVGRTLQELTIPGEVHVIAITRGGRTFLAMPGARFEVGDLIHLALLGHSMNRLQALLGDD